MITTVILTKNEDKNITDCIKSILWSDEILVIDDNSTDETVNIAKKLNCTVITHPLKNNFSEQRNFALQEAKGDFVFFLDADERVSDALCQEIISSVSLNSQYEGFYLKRRDFMWGKELKFGETGNIKLLRLGRKGAGRWEGNVHERWVMQGGTAEMSSSIQHFPHQTISEFLAEINFYTSIRAKELFKEGVRVSWLSILVYTKGKFLVNFVLKRGFLDGIPGLIMAMMMSLHSFLVRGKLWLMWHKK